MMELHNHGPEQGHGLACNEIRCSDGSVIGACQFPVPKIELEDDNPNIIRGED